MSNSILNTYLTSTRVNEITSNKRISEYTKITLFSGSPVNRTKSNLRISRKIAPAFWNVDDNEVKPIRQRTRVDDFTRDSFRHLFPQKSPKFQKSSETIFPRLTPDEKYFNKKIDRVVTHREELIRLRKQGFMIFRNK